MTDRFKNSDNIVFGVISDTHGLLRPSVAKSFESVDAILHAGDLDRPDILDSLNSIAPVIAVRGNMDQGAWANELPRQEFVEISNFLICMLHNIHSLDTDPLASGIRIIISGHTHQPHLRRENGVLYLNPGSAGPRRFDYPITAALLRIQNNQSEAQIIDLDP